MIFMITPDVCLYLQKPCQAEVIEAIYWILRSYELDRLGKDFRGSLKIGLFVSR